MMSAVAKQMGNYHDGRYNFVLPYLTDENNPPPHQQANAATSDMSTLINRMAEEISSLKGKMAMM